MFENFSKCSRISFLADKMFENFIKCSRISPKCCKIRQKGAKMCHFSVKIGQNKPFSGISRPLGRSLAVKAAQQLGLTELYWGHRPVKVAKQGRRAGKMEEMSSKCEEIGRNQVKRARKVGNIPKFLAYIRFLLNTHTQPGFLLLGLRI